MKTHIITLFIILFSISISLLHLYADDKKDNEVYSESKNPEVGNCRVFVDYLENVDSYDFTITAVDTNNDKSNKLYATSQLSAGELIISKDNKLIARVLIKVQKEKEYDDRVSFYFTIGKEYIRDSEFIFNATPLKADKNNSKIGLGSFKTIEYKAKLINYIKTSN